MHIQALARYTAVSFVLFIAGCNIYNPSGVGTTPDAGLVETGEQQYRDGNYAGAMASFQKAIAADSNQSMAYYGFAKAAVRFYNLDNIGILNDLDSTQKNQKTTGKLYFLEHGDGPNSVLTRRLQAALKVKDILGTLSDRGSLTRWASYLTDSTSDLAEKDTAFAEHKAFIRTYLDTSMSPSRNAAHFPLTDNRMPYTNLLLDQTAFVMVYAITSLYDFDHNGIIDFTTDDNLMRSAGLGGGGSGGGGFSADSLTNLAGAMETDTTKQQNFNLLIQNLSSNISSAHDLIAQIIPKDTKKSDTSSDTTTSHLIDSSVSASTNANIDSVITSLGDFINFYQIGDKKDNDGDGCVDEEIWDGKDNDDDGFVDEDARAIPADKPDGVDNDRNGLTDPYYFSVNVNLSTVDSAEGPVPDSLNPVKPKLLGFVNKFYLAYPDSVGMFVHTQARKDGNNTSVRIKLQKDSLFLDSRRTSLSVASYNQKLDSAKTYIGGCWRNYSPVGAGKRARK